MKLMVLAIVFIGSSLWGLYGQVPFTNVNPSRTFFERSLGSFQLTSAVYAFQQLQPIVRPDYTLDPLPAAPSEEDFFDFDDIAKKATEENPMNFPSSKDETIGGHPTSAISTTHPPRNNFGAQEISWEYIIKGVWTVLCTFILGVSVFIILWKEYTRDTSTQTTELPEPDAYKPSRKSKKYVSENDIVSLLEDLPSMIVEELQNHTSSEIPYFQKDIEETVTPKRPNNIDNLRSGLASYSRVLVTILETLNHLKREINDQKKIKGRFSQNDDLDRRVQVLESQAYKLKGDLDASTLYLRKKCSATSQKNLRRPIPEDLKKRLQDIDRETRSGIDTMKFELANLLSSRSTDRVAQEHVEEVSRNASQSIPKIGETLYHRNARNTRNQQAQAEALVVIQPQSSKQYEISNGKAVALWDYMKSIKDAPNISDEAQIIERTFEPITLPQMIEQPFQSQTALNERVHSTISEATITTTPDPPKLIPQTIIPWRRPSAWQDFAKDAPVREEKEKAEAIEEYKKSQKQGTVSVPVPIYDLTWKPMNTRDLSDLPTNTEEQGSNKDDQSEEEVDVSDEEQPSGSPTQTSNKILLELEKKLASEELEASRWADPDPSSLSK